MYKLFRANDTQGLRYYFSERSAYCMVGEIVMGRNDEFEVIDIEGDFTDDAEHTLPEWVGMKRLIQVRSGTRSSRFRMYGLA